MRPRLRLRTLLILVAALAGLLGLYRWATRPIDATEAVRIATDRLAAARSRVGLGPPEVVRVDVKPLGSAPGWSRRVSPGLVGPHWCVAIEYTAGTGAACRWRCILETDGTVCACQW